jgi:hypothetical protein
LLKDLTPMNIVTGFLAAIALFYGAKSYSESARANDLASRESCRQHPVCMPLEVRTACSYHGRTIQLFRLPLFAS